MITTALATALKEAGLEWIPALHDFFVVPLPTLDDRIFVIGDMLSYVERVQGVPALTFHGALEWALDYVVLTDVVWKPTEAQLREQVEMRLLAGDGGALRLIVTPQGYRCELGWQGEEHHFEAFGAADAYGKALLFLLRDGS